MTAARLPGLLAGLLALLLLAVGCTPARPTPTKPPPAPTPAAAGPFPSGRVTEPVPQLRPPGIVDPPPGHGLARYTDQRLTWRPCRQALQCATVLAPLDWSDLAGPALTLSVSRRPALGPVRGTVFVNPGGPGGSGLDLPHTLPAQGLERYDIVGWDPRGAGESTPIQCLDAAGYDALFSTDFSPDTAAEEQALAAAERHLGLACLRNSGELVTRVSTADTVADLDLLRQLVRAPRLNYYGASYGSVIGQLYAERYPATTGRLVLDGAVVPGSDEVALQTRGFAAAFDAFAGWCADRQCPLGRTRDAVDVTLTRLLTRLDGQPLVVGDRQLTQSLAVAGVVQVLYGNATSYPLLQRSLVAAVAGDGRALLALADVANERSSDGQYGQLNAAFPAIRCLDAKGASVTAALTEARRLAREVDGLGPFLGPDLTCAQWPVAARPLPSRITAPGVGPILVVGTTTDPATPYVSAQQLARRLRSGRLLTLRGVGHTAYRQSGCIQAKVVAFLADGVVPPDGATCE